MISDFDNEVVVTTISEWHSLATVNLWDDLLCRPYLSAVFGALDCTDGDYKALFALGLLYAICHNNGIGALRCKLI